VALEDRRIRGVFKSWRDRFANTPRKADYAWTTLSRILSVSKDRGLIGSNPCEGGGRLYVANRADKIWTNDDVALFLKVAPQEMALALTVAFCGRVSGRVTCLLFRGRHTMESTFDYNSRRLVTV